MGEQRDAGLLAQQALERLVGKVCNMRQFLGGGLDLQCAVGEGEYAVFAQIAVGNLHQEQRANHGCARCGFQNLQRRGEDLHGCAACAANQAITLAGFHHHGCEVDVVLRYQLMCLFFGHALLLAQLVQKGSEFLYLVGSGGVDDFGAFQVVALCVDLGFVAEDYQVGNALLQRFFGSGKDAVVVAFGQNDGLLVRFGAFDHRVDEHGHKHSFHG